MFNAAPSRVALAERIEMRPSCSIWAPVTRSPSTTRSRKKLEGPIYGRHGLHDKRCARRLGAWRKSYFRLNASILNEAIAHKCCRCTRAGAWRQNHITGLNRPALNLGNGHRRCARAGWSRCGQGKCHYIANPSHQEKDWRHDACASAPTGGIPETVRHTIEIYPPTRLNLLTVIPPREMPSQPFISMSTRYLTAGVSQSHIFTAVAPVRPRPMWQSDYITAVV